MNCTLIYFHRIHFPSASGQTIQVLRDYYAMSKTQTVHLLYRSPLRIDDTQINDALVSFGVQLTPSFNLHCIVDGWFGKYRTAKKVIKLIKSSGGTIIIVTRVPDHTETALSIRDRFSFRPIRVIFELHETAIPHMVYREQNRNWKASLSYKKEKKIFRKIDGILCTAHPQLAILDEKFSHHAPAIVLPNSYDEAFFQLLSKSIKRERNTFHMRYAGAFAKWKNTAVMTEALKFLPENVVLDIAGGKLGANKTTEQMLTKESQIHGVQNRINYFGFLPPHKVSSFLAEADCLLLPLGNNIQSRFFTSPIKLFEYAASNVPMIVTRQPTTLSLIQDGVHALMVEPDSPQDLAKAVQYLMQNYDFGQKLANNAKKWVTRYSANARAAEYKDFLNKLINKI
jgi:glycosyltransferase involved in cell wall biosynthesis